MFSSQYFSHDFMADRHGPIRTGIFTVEIDGVEIPGWRSITIPSSSTEQEDNGDGGTPTFQTTFQDLHMERGMQPGDTYLMDWRDTIAEGNDEDELRDIVITQLDEEHEPLFEYTFDDAWIKYYKPPSLDAAADGDIATEEVTLGFENMDHEDL